MEATRYPADPEHLKDVVQMQAEGLMACVDSMTHESQSLLARMQNLLSDVEQKLAETEMTDSLTGLMNRREMERRIGSLWLSGNAVTQLMYRVSCPVEGVRRDEVMQQAASRLAAQSRHNDLVSRWSENEFLVLFQGPAETANKRGEQVAQMISGPYALDSGETVDVTGEFEVMEHAPTASR
jgi:GGDEF domain-containing protein